MPLVFAGAPLVNVLYSMWQHPPKTAPSPMLYVGFLLAAGGSVSRAALQAAVLTGPGGALRPGTEHDVLDDEALSGGPLRDPLQRVVRSRLRRPASELVVHVGVVLEDDLEEPGAVASAATSQWMCRGARVPG